MGFVTVALAFAMLIAVAGTTAAAERNACGCYPDGSGACFCDKKAKCGCPGECEPKGCEERRDKQLQKEIEAETRKAAELNKKQKRPEEDESSKRAETTETPKSGEHAKVQHEQSAKPAPPAGHKLGPAQIKELARLIDAYLAEHPDARSKTTEELRNELSLTPR